MESQLGEGTIFKLIFPQNKEEVPAGIVENTQNIVENKLSATILLVEDNQYVRFLADKILKQQGYQDYTSSKDSLYVRLY